MGAEYLLVTSIVLMTTCVFARQTGCFLRCSLLFALLTAISLMIVARFCSLTANTSTASRFFRAFRIGGHRGSPKRAPENTIESFEMAKASHVDLIEFDLSLTKDGVAVLMHDDDLMRTCEEPGLIAAFTLDELRNKNAGKGFHSDRMLEIKDDQATKVDAQKDDIKFHRIPTLAETVDFCCKNNIKMLFDVKDGSNKMVSQIVSAIARNNLYDKVIVSSFFPWVSYAVKRADPKILTGITWRPHFFSYNDLDNLSPRFTGIKHHLAMILDMINVKLLITYLPAFLGAEMLLTNEKDINRQLVDLMDRNNVQVVAWTVNDARQMMYYVDTLQIPILSDVPHVYQDLKNVRLELLKIT